MTEQTTEGAALDIEVSEENCANLVSIAKGLLAEVDRLRGRIKEANKILRAAGHAPDEINCDMCAAVRVLSPEPLAQEP